MKKDDLPIVGKKGMLKSTVDGPDIIGSKINGVSLRTTGTETFIDEVNLAKLLKKLQEREK